MIQRAASQRDEHSFMKSLSAERKGMEVCTSIWQVVLSALLNVTALWKEIAWVWMTAAVPQRYCCKGRKSKLGALGEAGLNYQKSSQCLQPGAPVPVLLQSSYALAKCTDIHSHGNPMLQAFSPENRNSKKNHASFYRRICLTISIRKAEEPSH